MKIKRHIVHIEDPGRLIGEFEDTKCYHSYCGKWAVAVLEPWERAQTMEPLCKFCLRIMECRQNKVGIIELNGNSD